MVVTANIRTKRAGWLVVGAGFTGATAARRLAETTGETVVVIDRRSHLAGNAFDESLSGIRVHRYGPHIFHTNSDQVWDFLSRFTGWRAYEHRVNAIVDDQPVPLPFNFESIRRCFDRGRAERLIGLLTAEYGAGAKVPMLRLMQSKEAELRELGQFIHDKIFLNYSLKLWGAPPQDLQPSVTARVPVVVGEDTRYFHDKHQSMPKDGYAALFAAMLDHPNIEIALGTDYSGLAASDWPGRTLYTGAIDEFFDYRFGVLGYRSLRFQQETLAMPQFQPVGTVNYPALPELLRITELKHLTGDICPHTTIMREFPQQHVPGKNDAYYPLLLRSANTPLAAYRSATGALCGRVWFGGRLADYCYYNMDQACARGLALVDKEILQ